MSTHQLQAAALSIEIGVDVPHAQTRINRVTQSIPYWVKLLLQIAAIRCQAQTCDDIRELREFQYWSECVNVVYADDSVDSSRDYLRCVFVETAGSDLEWMGDGLHGLVAASVP